MDAQNVLTASVLDIVFDGRNKDYGAYILRKEYDKRLSIALASTASLIILLMALYYSGNGAVDAAVHSVISPVIEMSKAPDLIVETPKISPPKPAAQPKTKTVRFAGPPVIVKEALKDEMPPDNAAVADARIGTITNDGTPDDIVAPPLGASNGVTGSINEPATEDKIFIRAEIESAYPGGPAAWARFLNKTLSYPEEAQDIRIQGSVIVQFIVDTIGVVSNVEIISGPEELRNEAIRVIKKSGTWTPAIQNGRKVKSYKKQPITFKLMDE